jgi:hypothetical protein
LFLDDLLDVSEQLLALSDVVRGRITIGFKAAKRGAGVLAGVEQAVRAK